LHEKVCSSMEDVQTKLHLDIVARPVDHDERVPCVCNWVPLCPPELHQTLAVRWRQGRVLRPCTPLLC
jgi:hypothetical protein